MVEGDIGFVYRGNSIESFDEVKKVHCLPKLRALVLLGEYDQAFNARSVRGGLHSCKFIGHMIESATGYLQERCAGEE